MTQQQHNTRVALRRAIHVNGEKSNETRLAAIEFCYAHNIDPHYRYAVHQVVKPDFNDWDKPVVDADQYSVAEWQRVVARFVAGALSNGEH